MRILASENHKGAILHALRGVLGEMERSNASHYGKLARWELKEYIEFLEKQEQDPIELFLKRKCPECGVDLVYEVTCYCSKCGKEWWGDRVLKEFYHNSDPMFSDVLTTAKS
ncbi:MAG: hypothetical protein ABIB98_01755 [bacterium]